jgi:alginate O-acetyltransferase complex protein AlgI
MLFNSFPFLILVLATFALYYAPPVRRVQPAVLIAASMVFYAWNLPILLLLLVCSIATNAVASFHVRHARTITAARAWALGGIAANLLVLSAFKYGGLFARTFFGVDPHSDMGAFILGIPLPIGISFFTFQGMSLVMDTFRARGKPEVEAMVSDRFAPHAWRTMLYISMFAQLVAGPIVKGAEFMPQIRAKFLRDVRWEEAFRALVMGYFLKMVVADNLKDYTYWISYPYFEGRPSFDLIVMLFGYSMQIFADFAGYSLIAIGLGEVFGYHFPTNFNFPYIARSFSEFWRRWHISLSTWLRQYLYLPLGGNRKGSLRTYVNLMIVMFLGGLWHGAAWSYAVWGTTHGLALAVERLLGRFVRVPDNRFFSVLRGMGVFLVVTLAWLLFQLPHFGEAVLYFKAIARNTHMAPGVTPILYILLYSLPVVLYHLWYIAPEMFKAPLRRSEALAYATMLFLIVTNAGTQGAFIYFQF